MNTYPTETGETLRVPSLYARKSISFRCEHDHLDDLASWLTVRHQFDPIPSKINERHRLQNESGSMICIIYETGSVLAQGRDAASLSTSLSELVLAEDEA